MLDVRAPADRGGRYALKHTTRSAQAIVGALHSRLDVDTLQSAPADSLALNDIGRVTPAHERRARVGPLSRQPRHRQLHPDRRGEQRHRRRGDDRRARPEGKFAARDGDLCRCARRAVGASAAASASVFFVATGGNDTSPCTSAASPCLTIGGRDEGRAAPDTATINVGPGTFIEDVALNSVSDSGTSIAGAGSGAGGTTIRGTGAGAPTVLTRERERGEARSRTCTSSTPAATPTTGSR